MHVIDCIESEYLSIVFLSIFTTSTKMNIHVYRADSTYSHVITCWVRADGLARLCVLFPCVFVTFPNGVSGEVWYLIASIPGLCLLFF